MCLCPTTQDFYTVTAKRCEQFDDLAARFGRDPRQIRHSIVCFPPLTPWQSVQYFTDMVGRFRSIGIDEFVLHRPGSWRDEPPTAEVVFQSVIETVIPGCATISGSPALQPRHRPGRPLSNSYREHQRNMRPAGSAAIKAAPRSGALAIRRYTGDPVKRGC